MGLSTIVLAVAIIIVVFPITVAYSGGVLDEFFQTQEDKADAQQFGNNPTSGDIICDLKIHVEGQLDQDRKDILYNTPLFIGNLEVYMGSSGNYPQVAEAIWSNCRTKGTFSFASFFGQLNALTLVSGTTFDLEMTGASKTNGKALTENSNTKFWAKKVQFSTSKIPILELSWVDLPTGWATDFFLTNVKIDDYQLRFVAIGGGINNMGTNVPLIYTVNKPILT